MPSGRVEMTTKAGAQRAGEPGQDMQGLRAPKRLSLYLQSNETLQNWMCALKHSSWLQDVGGGSLKGEGYPLAAVAEVKMKDDGCLDDRSRGEMIRRDTRKYWGGKIDKMWQWI